MKNLCAKTVDRDHAYEVWSDGDWTWYVRKKYSTNDDAPYARWFCTVVTSITGPRGESGDCYVADIKAQATRVK